MLTCSQCGHDNDIGRIFCAKCGQKLELSSIGVPSGVRRGARKGKKGVPFLQLVAFVFKKFVQITFLAAAVAWVVSIWILPRDASRAGGEKDLETYQKNRTALEDAFAAKAGGQVTFREEEMNAKLAEAVVNTRKAAGENASGMQLEKLTVSLGDGTATLTIGQKWKWFRLAIQAAARTRNEGGRRIFVPTEIRIGRWLAPAILHPHFVPVLQKFLSDLSAEQQKMEEASAIEIKPGEFSITAPKPAA